MSGTEEETRGFLALMKGEGDEPGVLTRTKMKKLERGKAMDEIAALLRKEGVSVTGNQCDKKWKSLLARFKIVEDHNNSSRGVE